MDTVRNWTGDRPMACPWNALRDPFVARVLEAHRFKGELAFAVPQPSHRLVKGLAHFEYVGNRIDQMMWEQRKEQREQERRSAEARRG